MSDNIIIVHEFYINGNLADLLTKSISSWNYVQLRSRIVCSDNPNIFLEAS